MSLKKAQLLIFTSSLFFSLAYAQYPQNLDVKTIMQDPDSWLGSLPKKPYWSEDSKTIYFKWNPENADSDSLYAISIRGGIAKKVTAKEQALLPGRNGHFSDDQKYKVFSKNGDIFIFNLKRNKLERITRSLANESNPRFSMDQKRVIFQRDNGLFSWNRQTGKIAQLFDIKSADSPTEDVPPVDPQENFIQSEERELMQVLRQRKEQERRRKEKKNANTAIPTFYVGNFRINNIQLSPDEKFITLNLSQEKSPGKNTKIPNYITESGYTQSDDRRTKVGSKQRDFKLACIDIKKDTLIFVASDSLPGIQDFPKFSSQNKKEGDNRTVNIWGPFWSHKTNQAFVEVRSHDNKSRWLALLNPQTGELQSFEHQHDEAWIGGPGISWWNGSGTHGWLPDDSGIWFCSEESGFSHLYIYDFKKGEKKQLTAGQYEIYSPHLSRNKKYWYFSSNEEHPGERHFYRMNLDGSKKVKLTSLPGRNDGSVSPDGKQLLIRRSFSNQPWELYLQEAKSGGKIRRLTESTTEKWQQYNWHVPQIVRIPAKDGNRPYARLYKPQNPNGAAVLFVHGAGWLQNAHKWWSSYFREYMFHNLLLERGYTVLDIDFRGSAGYGRDWRTAIYRSMGDKDLEDYVDGAKWLVEKHGIDARRIGIYGGSYGGFITLMAQFTKPGVFKSGAALRPVTDWAHYNHGYTSNILNIPQADTTAYRSSSPIYFAEGLQDNLLICVGMLDPNVHFQDVVRLSQRLIELEKENWEVAFYPMEGHGFKEASSWTDEYRRIFKLFEQTLK
ncbi:MAG: S9 family peptidase [Calditrichaeota bacterium]|nr:MAG: S9 family peptidase [Calditrichota bacterium]